MCRLRPRRGVNVGSPNIPLLMRRFSRRSSGTVQQQAMKKFDPKRIRRIILDMAYSGATVQIGCAFSIVEVLAVLYRDHLRLDVADSRSSGRDYMVLSKGHGIM